MKRRSLTACILGLALIVPTATLSHDHKAAIEIAKPYARAMLPGAKVGGGYLTIVNGGGEDRLLKVTADRAGAVQLHEMKMDNGVMVMRELKEGIAVPANTTVDLKPGGNHIMFMNVAQPFKEGETVKAVLQFEKAGAIDIDFTVGPANGAAPHSGHGDHTD